MLAIILPCCILPVYAPHLEPRVVAIGLTPAAVLMPIVLLMALSSIRLMAVLSLKILDYFAAVFSTELLSNASSDRPQTEGFMNLFSYAEQVFVLLQMLVIYGVAAAVAFSSPNGAPLHALGPSPSSAAPTASPPTAIIRR